MRALSFPVFNSPVFPLFSTLDHRVDPSLVSISNRNSVIFRIKRCPLKLPFSDLKNVWLVTKSTDNLFTILNRPDQIVFCPCTRPPFSPHSALQHQTHNLCPHRYGSSLQPDEKVAFSSIVQVIFFLIEEGHTWSCCSSTSTFLPALDRIAAADRPPIPEPMTMASKFEGTFAAE